MREQVRFDDCQFPVDFFEKINVKNLCVERIEDENLFVCFLAKSTGLTTLDFQSGCLSQKILDQLHIACGRSLKYLKIMSNCNSGPELDYKSVLCKMPHLFRISLERLRKIDFKLVLNVLQHYRYSIEIYLKFSDSSIFKLVKWDGKHYRLWYKPKKAGEPSLDMEDITIEQVKAFLKDFIQTSP